MEFSEEQLKAIDTRGRNILLSAAAGSGKTTVLVERVLQLILQDNASIDRMLVVTFTKASAADMRAKLQKKLTERASDGDPRFHEQLMLLSQAHISTLHSFCSDFLRQNFEAAQIDPEFEIMDESAARQMRQSSIEDALEAAYEHFGTDEDLRALDYGRGADGIREAVSVLMNILEARPDPEAWLNRCTRDAKTVTDTACGYITAAAQRQFKNALSQINAAMNTVGRPEEYDDIFGADIDLIDSLMQISDYSELNEALKNTKFKPLARLKKTSVFDPEAKDKVMELRDSAKSCIKKSAKLFENMSYEDIFDDIARQLPQLQKLCAIAQDAAARENAAKEDACLLSYNDLEHRTLKALRDPDVAENLRGTFDYIFVDEYQDTSDLQEAMITAFARPDNVFTVGDVKQSIYRFRNAEPSLFLKKGEAYEKGEGGLLLPLTRNFRSERGILDFINMIFSRTMIGGDTDILYNDIARLNPGSDDAETSDACVELHLINKASASESADDEEPAAGADEAQESIAEMKDNEREGLFIAKRIRELMEENRSLRYSDIAIITRSRTPFGDIGQILMAEGIPVFADGVSSFYGSLEITYIITLLELIVNPRRDLEMLSVLHSPMVGLDAEALARIRISYPQKPYVDAVYWYAKEKDDDIARRLRAFRQTLEQWELKQDTLSLGSFIRLLLDESGFYTYAGALTGGAQRLANLDMFVAQACAYDNKYSGSLTRFLEYTHYLKERNETEAARLLTENDNVVRMMTIHHSKGLEYPVVFCPCLQRKYHAPKSSDALVAHRDIGIAIPYFDPVLRTRRDTVTHSAIREQQKLEDHAEELRLLYVMLTRAKSRLILSGTIQSEWMEYAIKLASGDTSPVLLNNHLEVIAAAYGAALLHNERIYSTYAQHTADEFKLNPQSAEAATPASELFDAIRRSPADYADERMDAAMNWQYPWPEDCKKPLKLTVTGLMREVEGPQIIRPLISRPQFMQEESAGMTGAERGTAYHRALELLELKALRGLRGEALAERIKARVDECARSSLMTGAQRDAVKITRIADFIESDAGQRLIASDCVRREWSFNAMLRMGDVLTPEEAGSFPDEDLLVQGTVDCCFLEEGEWVLLDYKTDAGKTPDELREHYSKQIRAYAIALEKLTGRRVRQALLCLLKYNEQIDMTESK